MIASMIDTSNWDQSFIDNADRGTRCSGPGQCAALYAGDLASSPSCCLLDSLRAPASSRWLQSLQMVRPRRTAHLQVGSAESVLLAPGGAPAANLTGARMQLGVLGRCVTQVDAKHSTGTRLVQSQTTHNMSSPAIHSYQNCLHPTSVELQRHDVKGDVTSTTAQRIDLDCHAYVNCLDEVRHDTTSADVIERHGTARRHNSDLMTSSSTVASIVAATPKLGKQSTSRSCALITLLNTKHLDTVHVNSQCTVDTVHVNSQCTVDQISKCNTSLCIQSDNNLVECRNAPGGRVHHSDDSSAKTRGTVARHHPHKLVDVEPRTDVCRLLACDIEHPAASVSTTLSVSVPALSSRHSPSPVQSDCDSGGSCCSAASGQHLSNDSCVGATSSSSLLSRPCTSAARGNLDAYSRVAQFLPAWDLERLHVVYTRLSECGFYFGRMSLDEARVMLRQCSVGTFLLRDSADCRYLFSLSVKTPRGTTSIRVVYELGAFRLDCDDVQVPQMPTFDCVLRLVQHYMRLARTENTSGGGYVFLESTGRRDTPVRLCRAFHDTSPAAMPTLKHLTRLAIHATLHETPANVDRLHLVPSLKTYLKDYPYDL